MASTMPRGAGGTSWALLDSLRGDPGHDGGQPAGAGQAQTERLDHLEAAHPVALEAGLGVVSSPRRTWKERPRASRESVKPQLVTR